MAFPVKKYDSILSDMINWVSANQNKITDFNEGSIIRSFLESIALEIEQIYIQTRVGFGNELKQVPFYAFNFVRGGSESSSGTVVFSRTGTTGTVAILTGTIVSTADGIQFETTADGSITAGNTDSASIAITAIESGKIGNVSANTINTIVTPIVGVDTVDNASGTTGGQDQETEAEYLTRFREFIEGLGQSNVYGLISASKSINGVRSASVLEHFPPDASYNVTVYIDDGAGNASAGLIAEVELLLEGDGTVTNPGYKGAGINLRVLAPSKVSVNVTVEVTSDNSISDESLIFLVEEAIESYINELLLGEDVIKNKLIESIMSVAGVTDLTLTLPSTNTSISSSQIARSGTITVTVA